jgi:hypothetical protein
VIGYYAGSSPGPASENGTRFAGWDVDTPVIVRPRSKWHAGALLTAAALAGGCGSAARTGQTVAPVAHPASSRPSVDPAHHSATIHFGEGRQSVAFAIREPAGVILLYRIRAPVGTRIEGTTQLPSTSAPLLIRSTRSGPGSSCGRQGLSVVCTVGEEWCPMPEGTWHVHLRKLAGPAGDVTIWFHVGTPPGKRAV